MSMKHKSPSRLRRDQYRLSVYNCCKQILEIERKNDEIIVQQDQIALMNDAYLEKLERIEKLEKEWQRFQKYHQNRKSLVFTRALNIDIPPAALKNKNNPMQKRPCPDL